MSEVEYCYDKNGVRHEVGPSMKDMPTGAKVISCPICRACLNQRQYEEHGYQPECAVLHPIPEDIDMGRVYQCEYYEADKDSFDYDLVKKLMGTGKPLD